MSEEQLINGSKASLQPTEILLTRPSRSWGPVFAPLLGLTVVAAVAWAFHYIWHRFDPATYMTYFLYLWVPAGATKIFYNYRRQFRPDQLPSLLSEDSAELAKLTRKRTLLNRVGWSCFGLCLVLGLTVRQFIPVHSGDECYLIPDVLFPWVALPLILSFAALLWSAVLEANMKERTPPATKPLRSSRGRKIPTVIAGKPFQGNSFHSDHWGKGI